jgi:cytochrome c553
MTTNRTLMMVALLACAPALAFAQTGSAERGSQKVQMCQGCHGIPGWRTAFPEVYAVPKIAGQHQAYIVKALQEYKAGERMHPTMRSIAAQLSDQDMQDLAAYYGQSGLTTVPK